MDANSVFADDTLLGDPDNRGDPDSLSSYAVRKDLGRGFDAWFGRVTPAAQYAYQARSADDPPMCDQCGQPFAGGETVFNYCSDVDLVPNPEMSEPYAQRAYCAVCRPYVPRFPAQSANEIILGFTLQDDWALTDPFAVSWSPEGHGIPWTPSVFRDEVIMESIRARQLETYGPADDIDLLINLGTAPQELLDAEGDIASEESLREATERIDQLSPHFPHMSNAAQSGQIQHEIVDYRETYGNSLKDVEARITAAGMGE